VRDTDEVIAALQAIEERLRELAYGRLRAAAEDGDPEAAADERRLLAARRAVERAIKALGGAPSD
jgi:hypothetical protein